MRMGDVYNSSFSRPFRLPVLSQSSNVRLHMPIPADILEIHREAKSAMRGRAHPIHDGGLRPPNPREGPWLHNPSMQGLVAAIPSRREARFHASLQGVAA